MVDEVNKEKDRLHYFRTACKSPTRSKATRHISAYLQAERMFLASPI